MPDQFAAIDIVTGRQEAQFIKAYLNANGFNCELSEEAGGAHGFSVDALARMEIPVPSKQLGRAREVLREHEKSKS